MHHSRRPKAERGVALITVMLVVALATVAAVAMAQRLQIDIRRAGNTMGSDQGYAYARGAEQWALHVLARDRKENAVDDLTEAWATQLPPIAVDGGTIQGSVSDLQGRFNLNDLIAEGQAGKVAQERFLRLLQLLEIEPALLPAILDWLDANQDVTFPDGAEDPYYLNQPLPYRAANRPMTSASELRLVKGVTPEIYRRLRDLVTALPAATAINVNTAPAAVLAALAPGVTLAQAQQLVLARQEKPYKNVAELLQAQVFAGKPVSTEGLSVSSQYFLVDATAVVGRVQTRLRSVVHRDDAGRGTVTARSEGLL